MPDEDLIRKYEDTLNADEEIETTFQRLRRDGHSRKEAVQILLALLDLSLSEAKRVLATRTTWAEVRTEQASSDENDSSSSVPPAPG
jgi:Mg2+/Co2+ transporter CorB